MPQTALSSCSNRDLWKTELANSFTKIEDLCNYLQLNPEDLDLPKDPSHSFSFRAPLSYVDCISKRDPKDPLLLQILPVQQEIIRLPGFTDDPVGDQQALKHPAILQKYFGRILLLVTGGCAIHCRYCFRKEFPYQENQLTEQRENEAIEIIRQDSTLTEIILSGGDPLLVTNSRLNRLVNKLESITHLKRLRIHSRIPVILPSRIDDNLLAILTNTKLQTILVIHANHPNELNPLTLAKLTKLSEAGITILNQSVLLKGINDDAKTLCQLSEKLFEAQVLPYYLHMLDKTKGTAHFEVSEIRAKELMLSIQAKLPGYLVPKLVREQPGETAKTML